MNPSNERELKEVQLQVTELEKVVEKGSEDAERLHAELQMCGDRFHDLADHLHQVFWIVEAKTDRLLYVSPAFETIWGRTCKSLYEDNQSWKDALHPEDKERVLNLAFKKYDTGQYEYEYRIIRPDGSIRWIWDRGYAVPDEQGDINRFVGIADDFTDKKKAEEQAAMLAAIIEYADDAIVIRVAQSHDASIHLVLSDVVMPYLGGRQLAERLAEVRPGLKMLFVSGYTDDAVVRHGILEADVAFLQKPFTPSALANKVRAVLDG